MAGNGLSDELLLVGIAIGTEHHGSESVCAHADTGSSERAIFHVLSSVGLRLALAHVRAVGENDRLPAMRPPDSRRAAAALRQDPYAFAPSETAISRRFRWPLALPSSHFARCPLRRSASRVPRRCTLRPQVYSGRTGESARRWRRCRSEE